MQRCDECGHLTETEPCQRCPHVVCEDCREAGLCLSCAAKQVAGQRKLGLRGTALTRQLAARARKIMRGECHV